MDSLGETGRIQVEEKTAQLLMECLCTESKSFTLNPEGTSHDFLWILRC